MLSQSLLPYFFTPKLPLIRLLCGLLLQPRGHHQRLCAAAREQLHRSSECCRSSWSHRHLRGTFYLPLCKVEDFKSTLFLLLFRVYCISQDASKWSAYKGGIFNGCNQAKPDIDHAVVLVGYGEENGQKYWLVLLRLEYTFTDTL